MLALFYQIFTFANVTFMLKGLCHVRRHRSTGHRYQHAFSAPSWR